MSHNFYFDVLELVYYILPIFQVGFHCPPHVHCFSKQTISGLSSSDSFAKWYKHDIPSGPHPIIHTRGFFGILNYNVEDWNKIKNEPRREIKFLRTFRRINLSVCMSGRLARLNVVSLAFLYAYRLHERTAKALVRLCGCTGLPVSLMFTYSIMAVFVPWSSSKHYTDKTLYTDTRYNDKIRYNENLTAWEVTISHRLCKNIVFNAIKRNIYFG